MKRLVVLLVAVAAFGALGASALVACGGNDKPPMTPDNIESSSGGDGAQGDGGATPASSSTPAK